MVSTSPVGAHSRPYLDDDEPLTLGLWLIVVFKGITALLLWGAFVLLLMAGRQDPRNFFGELIFRTFRGNPPQMAIHFLVSNLDFISNAMLVRVAVATSVYAAIESLEAIGLAMRKWWAEWLVILITVSFIPLEVYEIALRPNPFKVGTLVCNIVILGYLLKRLLDNRAHHRQAILHQS